MKCSEESYQQQFTRPTCSCVGKGAPAYLLPRFTQNHPKENTTPRLHNKTGKSVSWVFWCKVEHPRTEHEIEDILNGSLIVQIQNCAATSPCIEVPHDLGKRLQGRDNLRDLRRAFVFDSRGLCNLLATLVESVKDSPEVLSHVCRSRRDRKYIGLYLQ